MEEACEGYENVWNVTRAKRSRNTKNFGTKSWKARSPRELDKQIRYSKFLISKGIQLFFLLQAAEPGALSEAPISVPFNCTFCNQTCIWGEAGDARVSQTWTIMWQAVLIVSLFDFYDAPTKLNGIWASVLFTLWQWTWQRKILHLWMTFALKKV